MSGQTLTDRIAAAQYQLTGSEVATRVCKATTHEVMAPKKKHLDCECYSLPGAPSFIAEYSKCLSVLNTSTCEICTIMHAQPNSKRISKHRKLPILC